MEGTYLSILPAELMNIICSYLSNVDIYICTQSTAFLKGDLYLQNDNRITAKFIKNVFKQPDVLENITVLNMSGIFWIPAADIRDGIKKLEKLQILLLFDTKMDITRLNIKIYMELCNLKVLGLTEKPANSQALDPAFRKVNCSVFFYHKKTNTCQMWNEHIKYVQCIQVLQKVTRGLKIYNSNWLQTALDLFTSKVNMLTFDAKYKKAAGIQQIDGSCFVGTDEEVKTKFERFSNVKHLLIKPDLKSMNIRSMRLDLLQYIPNLIKLDIHIPIHLGANFLNPIFANCPKLKFLKIKNENAQMNLVHLKMAKALEDFSYTTAFSINLSRFFMEFQEDSYPKLRRLYMNYGMGAPKMDLPNLSKFLIANPQLYCFILVSEITISEMKKIQDVFNKATLNSFTYFKVLKWLYNIPTDMVTEDIPISHYDLFDCGYELKSIGQS